MTKYRHRISIQQVRIYFISSDLFGHCVQDRVFNLKIRTMFPFSDTTVFMISILIWSDKRYVLRQSTNQRHLKGCSNLCFCTVSYTRFLQMAKGPRPYLGPTSIRPNVHWKQTDIKPAFVLFSLKGALYDKGLF